MRRGECAKSCTDKRDFWRERERERVVSRAIVVVSEETLLLERTKWSIRGQNVDGQKEKGYLCLERIDKMLHRHGVRFFAESF